MEEIKEPLEYETCKKCGIQQERNEFMYTGTKRDICKFCNKSSNIVPRKYDTTTKQSLDYLNKIVYDPQNETSVLFQMQVQPLFEFLKRQHCKEMEDNGRR
jgi:hypothetical protein